MVLVERATEADRADVERLVAAYHESEGVPPQSERIAWAVEQQLMDRFPGILLVAREAGQTVGVALAVYQPSAELGRTFQVNDFYVEPESRRKAVGRALAVRLLEEAAEMGADVVVLEVLSSNDVAAAFWRSLGFSATGRMVYGRTPRQGEKSTRGAVSAADARS